MLTREAGTFVDVWKYNITNTESCCSSLCTFTDVVMFCAYYLCILCIVVESRSMSHLGI